MPVLLREYTWEQYWMQIEYLNKRSAEQEAQRAKSPAPKKGRGKTKTMKYLDTIPGGSRDASS